MRVFITGLIAAVALGAIASFVLSSVQEDVYQAYSSPSVRVGNPGENLVGERWTGNPRVTNAERAANTKDGSGGS